MVHLLTGSLFIRGNVHGVLVSRRETSPPILCTVGELCFGFTLAQNCIKARPIGMQPLGVGGVDERDFDGKNCYESSSRDWSALSAPIGERESA
ncbi:hypothetical protein TNCV_4488211 [Trichonephila clavipes]|nr:hypothetical protein TNCV_4488211 [Trichonephila clavipes]